MGVQWCPNLHRPLSLRHLDLLLLLHRRHPQLHLNMHRHRPQTHPHMPMRHPQRLKRLSLCHCHAIAQLVQQCRLALDAAAAASCQTTRECLYPYAAFTTLTTSLTRPMVIVPCCTFGSIVSSTRTRHPMGSARETHTACGKSTRISTTNSRPYIRHNCNHRHSQATQDRQCSNYCHQLNITASVSVTTSETAFHVHLCQATVPTVTVSVTDSNVNYCTIA